LLETLSSLRLIHKVLELLNLAIKGKHCEPSP